MLLYVVCVDSVLLLLHPVPPSSLRSKEREHALRVNAEMLSWATGQLSMLANDTNNSSMQVVIDAIQS